MVKMAKLSLIFAVVLAVTAFVIADDEEVNPFIKTFHDLHKEPGTHSLTRANVKTLWIEQKLDHFNESETRTWQMRYMSNDEFYKPGSPLFIFVGGEWSISAGSISGGHFYDMAKEHNGYLFYTEHRYYGESRPVSAMTNDNMKYLDVQQALADLAHFIRTMKATIAGLENSKVILAGGSYTGSLVTWFKKLYPDLATGCWASSGPLRAKADYYEYKIGMGESIMLMGSEICYDRIKRGIAELESMFANKRGAEVKAMLRLCNKINEDNDLDLFTLFYEISEIFAGLVQSNPEDIQSVCNTIMEEETDVIGVSNYIVQGLNSYFGCVDLSYRSYLKPLTDPSFTGNVMRPWIYQTCNEFGWHQTSSSPYQPFGTKFPLDFFTTLCADAYGDQFTNEYIQKRMKETNKIFGGLNPNVENVYWTHGQLDPWKYAGIQKHTMATVIPFHSHCSDFDSISKRDSPELRASKQKIAALVREWLA